MEINTNGGLTKMGIEEEKASPFISKCRIIAGGAGGVPVEASEALLMVRYKNVVGTKQVQKNHLGLIFGVPGSNTNRVIFGVPRPLNPKPCFPVPGSVPRPRRCLFWVIWTDTDRFGPSLCPNRRFRTRIVTIL